MDVRLQIALAIIIGVFLVVFVLRRSIKAGRIKLNRKGVDASLEADGPVAQTRFDGSGADLGDENRITVTGDTEAAMRDLKAGKKNIFNIGNSPPE